MFATRIDIPKAARESLNELLNKRLAEIIDLALQAKQAHWNMKGPSFIALHELFDEIADAANGHADSIAERVAALGGEAEGTVAAVAKKSKLKEYPLKVKTGTEHIEALADALATAGKHIRGSIDEANELKDANTADLFTEVSRDLDKYLWFVEAHLQAPK